MFAYDYGLIINSEQMCSEQNTPIKLDRLDPINFIITSIYIALTLTIVNITRLHLLLLILHLNLLL